MSLVVIPVAIGLLCVAAWRDLVTRTIPDGVSIALAAIGVAAKALTGLEALAAAALGALVLGLILLLLHARGYIGGGDVKLATALALGLSPLDTWNMVVATALAGGVLALIYLALPRLMRRGHATRPDRAASLPRRFAVVEAWRIRRGGPLPYGVAIAAGGTLVLLQTTAS
ncbi:A24 family peptidase [Falsiroseomonas oryziterrae]|uniref:A24 family peptidase n=1 Tax=Falsiroseomonas oryziterrae TaxID=2911368 RepID=UPI001F010B40|nr:prepilin peptidase [Roseomonas sp. NPKOSM-4]